MFFLGGKKSRQRRGDVVRVECPVCKRATRMVEIVEESSYSAYLVPVKKTKKVVGLRCTECGNDFAGSSTGTGCCAPGCALTLALFLLPALALFVV